MFGIIYTFVNIIDFLIRFYIFLLNFMRIFALILFLFSALVILNAQERTLYFTNGSFEGEAQDAVTPVGWHPCELGSTPDILPGVWGVYQEPSDGDSYVGLITRGDGSFESIGQRLSQSLKAHECYKFSIDLARSPTYADYNQPIRLMVWGGKSRCDKKQLLFSSGPIRHAFWKTYQIKFTAKFPINYIIFEAYFEEEGKVVRGNILLDNLSPLVMCPRA